MDLGKMIRNILRTKEIRDTLMTGDKLQVADFSDGHVIFGDGRWVKVWKDYDDVSIRAKYRDPQTALRLMDEAMLVATSRYHNRSVIISVKNSKDAIKEGLSLALRYYN